MERTRNRWDNPSISAAALGVACALAAAAGGLLLVYGGPAVTAAALLGVALAIWMVRRQEIGFAAIIAIVTLLPFAALPIKVAVTPTFLDLALLGTIAVWWLHRSLAERPMVDTASDRAQDPAATAWHFVAIAPIRPASLVLTPVGPPLLVFMGVAVFAFTLGLANAPLTSNVLRHFVELLLSLGFFFVVVNYVQDRRTLRWLVQLFILFGAVAAAIGLVLWVLPNTIANDLLNRLQVFGYGGGDVLRYINDDPTGTERAIGTSVDPNVFGGLLLVIGAIAGPQLVARKPVISRPLAWLATGLIGLTLILTVSRGSFLGLVCALAFVGVLRYRRVLPLLVVVAVLLLVLPVTQSFVDHLIAGFMGQDLATQMRFGEYGDALTLIGRYPIFGVGFSGAPDLDLYLGVSSLYLLVAEEMGMLGLLAFFAIIVGIFGYAWQAWRALGLRLVADPASNGAMELESIWLGLHAALVGWLVGGIFDHYTMSLDFQATVTMIWFVVGLAVAASRLALTPASSPAVEERRAR